MGDKDVQDFLTAWGVEEYIEVFRVNAITISTLPLLTEDMIKELVPTIGHRARFKSNLEEWKSIILGLPTTSSQENCEDSSGITNAPSIDNLETSLINLDSCSFVNLMPTAEPSTSTATTDTVLHLPNPEFGDSQQKCEVSQLLNASNEGKSLHQTFGECGLLDNAGRRKLCRILITTELRDDPDRKVSSARLLNLSYQITKVFKQEHASTYFIPYISYGPGLKRAAKGKLLDCLNNTRREYRKAGLIKSSRSGRSSRSSLSSGVPSPIPQDSHVEDPVLDETVADNLTWLRNSCDPWELVEKNWELTARVRLKRLMGCNAPSIAEYMSEYPSLRKPTGHLLLAADFNKTYPGYSDNLFNNFPIYKRQILELARNKLKNSREPTVINLLKEYLRCAEGDEETSNLATFHCLPFLIGSITTRQKKSKTQWRPSKLEMRDGFITHVQSDAEIEETVTRRRDKLAGFGHTLQPFILIVGTSLDKITSYFVIVDNTYYKLHSILASVDCCFKIILTLNAQYPAESSSIWFFIQKGFYGITTIYDKGYTSVNALLSDVGIPSEKK